MTIIKQIVDRIHVSASNREVIRRVQESLLRAGRDFVMPKGQRKEVYRLAIKYHKANRELYGYVMSGGHGYAGRKRRRK